MKCIKCKTNNINNANFCKSCGYQFSKEEQTVAKNKTFTGKLERLKKVYNTCTLKVITDHIVFKICSLLLVLILGIVACSRNGNSLKILNSEAYDVQYNTNSDEYYLLTKNDKIDLNVYVPNRIDDLVVNHYDSYGELIESYKYDKDNKVFLANTNDEYYTLESEKTKSKIKVYVRKVD